MISDLVGAGYPQCGSIYNVIVGIAYESLLADAKFSTCEHVESANALSRVLKAGLRLGTGCVVSSRFERASLRYCIPSP